MKRDKSDSNSESKDFQHPMSAGETMVIIEKRISERLETIDEMTSQLEAYMERITELKKLKEELEENS